MNDLNVKAYNSALDEVPFLDSSVRCKLVASALASTGTGKRAANFLIQVSDNQEAIDSKTRVKAAMGGKFGLFQQSLTNEASAAIVVNIMASFGYKGTSFADLNKLPEENGMTGEVAVTSEVDTYDGKSRVKVKYVNPVDLSLTTESIADLDSVFGNLFTERKKGPLQIKKSAASTSAPAPQGSNSGPPPRDPPGTPVADDDVPF